MARLIATVLFVGFLACPTEAAGVEAKKARTWLSAHRDAPQADQLADLKATDPNSYSIVQALLTKQKLGLLDPRHPMASFGAPKDNDDEAYGAAAFAKFASPSDHVKQGAASSDEEGSGAPEVYPGVGTGHKDMFSWKPASSGVDDDNLVQSVMGGTSAGSSESSGSSFSSVSKFLSRATPPSQEEEAVVEQPSAAPQPAFNVGAAAQAPEPSTPAEVPAASSSQDSNPYLDGIDFGARAKAAKAAEEAAASPATPAAEPAAAATDASNPYLQGIDFSSDASKPAVKKHHEEVDTSTNALASFSWGGADAPKQPVASAAEESSEVTLRAPAPVEAKPAMQANALSRWLGGGGAAAMLQKQKDEQDDAPKAKTNYYEMDLQ